MSALQLSLLGVSSELLARRSRTSTSPVDAVAPWQSASAGQSPSARSSAPSLAPSEPGMSVSPPTLVRTVSSDSLYAPSVEDDVDTTYRPTVVVAETDASTLAFEDASLNASFYDPYKTKHRRRTSPQQLAVLEAQFAANTKPDAGTRKAIASDIGMTPREVQVWFQNRRAKVKKLAKRAAAESGSLGDDTPPMPAAPPPSLGVSPFPNSPSIRNVPAPPVVRPVMPLPTHSSVPFPSSGGEAYAMGVPNRRSSLPVSIPSSATVPPRALPYAVNADALAAQLQRVGPEPPYRWSDALPTPPLARADLDSAPSSASTHFTSYPFGSAGLTWPTGGYDGTTETPYSYPSSVAGSVLDVSDPCQDGHGGYVVPAQPYPWPSSFDPSERRASCPADFVANFGNLGMPASPPQPPARPISMLETLVNSIVEQPQHRQPVESSMAQPARRHSLAAPMPISRHVQAQQAAANGTYSPALVNAVQPTLHRRASCAAMLDPIAEHRSSSPIQLSPGTQHVLPASFFNYQLDPASPILSASPTSPSLPFGRSQSSGHLARKARSASNVRMPYPTVERRSSRPDLLESAAAPASATSSPSFGGGPSIFSADWAFSPVEPSTAVFSPELQWADLSV